jgi:dihydroneopterin aldolase
MDKIFIHALKTEAIIGIFDWERQVRQTVILDIELSADTLKAALSDSIEDTLNYKRVAKRVLAFVEASQFHLVETLAEHIAMLILEEFSVAWVAALARGRCHRRRRTPRPRGSGAAAHTRGACADRSRCRPGDSRLRRQYRGRRALRCYVKRIPTGRAVAQHRDEPCRGRRTRAPGDRGSRHHGRRGE